MEFCEGLVKRWGFEVIVLYGVWMRSEKRRGFGWVWRNFIVRDFSAFRFRSMVRNVVDC